MAESARSAAAPPALEITGLTVHYGHVPALHGVDLALASGVLSVVGRNGMGKTTLCNAVTGLLRPSGGSIRFDGHELVGLSPDRIARLGIGYVPQGRRVWPSLTVDEHLRLAYRTPGGSSAGSAIWTLERVYDAFPRLAERRTNGGAQLSGGEQQMLAIARALLGNPRLLVMDEPSEGLAPVIVEQVARMLKQLGDEQQIAILLIEQNLGVAIDVSDRVAIMVNGRIARIMGAAELAADPELQQRLLGVGRHDDDDIQDAEPQSEAAPGSTPGAAPGAAPGTTAGAATVPVFTIRRQSSDQPSPDLEPATDPPVYSRATAPTRWSSGVPPSTPARSGRAPPSDGAAEAGSAAPTMPTLADLVGRSAYVAGTFDTKREELTFLKNCLVRRGLDVVTIDLSTTGRPSPADVGPQAVAAHHPDGALAVFSGDRGTAVTGMARAFERFIVTRRDIGGVISAGGSGGTALATPAMRALPVGLPKVMVSTVASGDVKRYVGPSDIMMMYSVTDVQGINRISQLVLSNAAHALAGMIAHAPQTDARRSGDADLGKPAIGLTMFGVTTPCIQQAVKALEPDFDCLVFHATGTGGQSMEKLVDSGMLAGVIDATTTEVADHFMGGVFPCDEDRFGAMIRRPVPYVVSCGALDMVNWGPMETVPERFRGRNLYVHNPQVTLMRTTPEENERMGRWIAGRLNLMEGPLRLLIPEGGVSAIDLPGGPFHDPEADRALFAALEQTLRQTGERKLIRLPYNINDPAFSEALVQNFREISESRGTAYATI